MLGIGSHGGIGLVGLGYLVSEKGVGCHENPSRRLKRVTGHDAGGATHDSMSPERFPLDQNRFSHSYIPKNAISSP